MNYPKAIFLIAFLIILLSNVHFYGASAQTMQSKEDSTSLKKIEDSLKNNLIVYFGNIEAYDQALSCLKDKKQLNKKELITYYYLLQKKENLKWIFDSIRLAEAIAYKRNGLSKNAEVAFSKLQYSSYSTIRKRAILETDTLLQKHKQNKYEEYIIEPTTYAIKKIVPFVGVLILLFFILRSVYLNRKNNKNNLTIHCNDEVEATAFITALKTMNDKILSHWYQEQLDSSVVSPGSIRTLPHLEPESSTELKNLIADTIPSKYVQILNFLWRIGISPYYTLDITVEEQPPNITLNLILKRKKIIISEWNKTCHKSQILNTRLDLAFEVIVAIQDNS